MDNEFNCKRKRYKLKYGRVIFLIVLVTAVIFLPNSFTGAAIKDFSFDLPDFSFDLPFNSNIKVAAIVAGHEITLEQLNEQYGLLPDFYRDQLDKKTFLDQMINQIIYEEVLMEKALDYGITVSEEEITQTLEEIKQENDMDDEAFINYLVEQNVELEEALIQLKKQLLIDKFLKETLFDSVIISDKQIKEYYDENIELFKQSGELLAFEEVKEQIKVMLGSEQERELFTEFMDELKSETEIEILI